MNIAAKIVDLNKRAGKLWLPAETHTDVIAVCIFVSSETNFAQVWFSHWDAGGIIERKDMNCICEGETLQEALQRLDEYVSYCESNKTDLVAEGNKIADEIVFGD